VSLDDIPVEFFRQLTQEGKPAIPVGLPLTLGGPVIAQLRREPGGNLLVITEEEAAGALLVAGFAALRAANVQVDLLDFGPLDATWLTTLDPLDPRPARRRETEARLQELAELIRERIELRDYASPARVCVIAALHRAREFDVAADDSAADLLEEILRDGPEVGVHVVAWCEKPVSLSRRLSSSSIREFGIRILGPMSREDSFSLVDSDLAATIKTSQAVLDDHDRAITTRLRRFRIPSDSWMAKLAEGL
jgi:hypothetical protein